MCNRKILAFIFPPLLPSLFFVFSLHLSDFKIVALVLVFSLSFSYLPCILFGIPAVKFLEKRNSLSVVNMSLFGTLLGMVVFYIFGFVISMMLGSPKNIVPTFGDMMSGALLGISVALPFSLISGFPLFNSGKGGHF